MASTGSQLLSRVDQRQLDLFGYYDLTAEQVSEILGEILRHYWFLRNLRGGRFGQAAARRHYRAVAKHKKSLLLAGYQKASILRFLAYCRLGGVPVNFCDHRHEDFCGDTAC